jgi:hypothetical protein
MLFKVYGFQNCSYHLEWPLTTLEDPQFCPILNPQKMLFQSPPKKSYFSPKKDLLQIFKKSISDPIF